MSKLWGLSPKQDFSCAVAVVPTSLLRLARCGCMTEQAHIGSVLLVDDDAKLRFVLSAYLRNAGFEVFEAENGHEAIDLARQAKPDVIIMDVAMPTMDGIEATRQIKATPDLGAIPIIILTASAKTADLLVAFEAGAQEYVRKPFELTEMLARLRTVHRLVLARRELDTLNRRLEYEVQVKSRRLQVLYDYMRDLNRADSQDQILDLVVRAVGDVCGARRISIMLMDGKGEHLVCRRAVGIDPSVASAIRIAPNEGISGQVFRTGRTLAASTVGPGTSDRGYDAEAFVSTPLETPAGVLGVVNATDKPDGEALLREEVECIRSIADAAAIALDNVRRRDQLSQSVRVLLKTVGHLAEYRDEETTLHLERVARMTGILARQLARSGPYVKEIHEEAISMLVQAAPLHDIGKVGIPDEILTKPGRLTDEEFRIMKSHTDIGRRVLSMPLDEAHPVPLLKMCIDIAYCHHERYDGRGYPRRIVGEAIPLSARIVALVDAYDAITSRRRYKAERSHEEAVEIIRAERGAHFDPHIVDAFLACHAEFDGVRARYADAVELAGSPA